MSPASARPVEVGDIAGMFERYARPQHRYCASRVGPSVAEDVVAETFLVAHEQRRRYDPAVGSESAWLFGIATNLLRRHRRREVRAWRVLARTGVDPLIDDGLAERAAARADASAQARRVAAALASLPRRQRGTDELAAPEVHELWTDPRFPATVRLVINGRTELDAPASPLPADAPDLYRLLTPHGRPELPTDPDALLAWLRERPPRTRR